MKIKKHKELVTRDGFDFMPVIVNEFGQIINDKDRHYLALCEYAYSMIWLLMCILAVGLCIITCKRNSIASLKSARILYLRLLGVVATTIEVRICSNGKGRKRGVTNINVINN